MITARVLYSQSSPAALSFYRYIKYIIRAPSEFFRSTWRVIPGLAVAGMTPMKSLEVRGGA